jgi:2-dehydro-3-deoxygluconokinase
VAYTHVLLGDAHAFELYFDILSKKNEILLAEVKKRFPGLNYLAMTSRYGLSASHNRYQGALYDGANIYISPTYDLPDMLDRIGAGDALMAGLLFGLCKENPDMQETIDFAVAASALKHYIRGDYNLSSESEIRALMQGNKGSRVER